MKRILVLSLAALLALGLCACSPFTALQQKASVGIIGQADGASSLSVGITEAAAAPATATVTVAATAGADTTVAATDTDMAMDLQAFSNAFRVLPQNPLEENLQHALYLEAMASPAPGEGAAGTSGLSAYADQLQALVNGNGLHYVDVMTALGMDMEAEHWAKGDKFKKVDKALGEVIIFDGKTGVKYDPEAKTGHVMQSAEIESARRSEGPGMLALIVASPYESKPDEKVGDWDCAVFYLGIEMMGMKGNTLYIDKATGLIVKNVYGDPKDTKNSMGSVVKSIDTAPVGDDVFAIPTDITFE